MVKVSGDCFKQDRTKFNHKTIVNIYIVREINKNFLISSYAQFENCLFRAVILTKNINDIDEYKYFGYDIGFHRRDFFSVDKVFGRNCIIFGIDMSSSAHADNKKKYVLILGKSKHKDWMVLH